MIPTAETYIRIAVEGASDEEMARKLMRHAGLTVSHVLVKKGSGELDKVIPRLAKTTVNDPWVVFRDADTACPVELRRQLIGDRPHDGAFELRFPTSMTEAWFLADAIGFAAHFRITRGRIPAVPDDLEHAKRSLLGLCQQSKSRALREDVVRPSGRPGPLPRTISGRRAKETRGSPRPDHRPRRRHDHDRGHRGISPLSDPGDLDGPATVTTGAVSPNVHARSPERSTESS